MKVLITGAQGFIGAWVARKLLERGAELIAFDLHTEPVRLGWLATPEQLKRVRFEAGHIEDTGRIKALVREHEVTHIMHLAAVLMPFCQQQPVRGGMINVIGTLNVFEAARDAGRPVRVVYASSSAVWGPEEAYGGHALTERDETRPDTHYGVFKHANEGNARVFWQTDGIPSVGLRPWAVYGAGRDHGLTGDPTLAMKALVLGKPFHVRLGGRIDLQYVEDVADTFVAALETPPDGAWVFNLAGDIVEVETQFLDTLERLRPGARQLITASGRQVPVAYRMDDSGLRARMPGLPRTPLETGARRTLEIFERLHAEGRLDPSLGQ